MTLEKLGIIDVFGGTPRPGKGYAEERRDASAHFRIRTFESGETIDIDGNQIDLRAVAMCYLEEVNRLWALVDKCDDIIYEVLSYADENDDLVDLPYPWVEKVGMSLAKMSTAAEKLIVKIAKTELDVTLLSETDCDA